MEPKIMKCEKCKPHPFQDRTYGEKMRVHNPNFGESKTKLGDGWGCTVCGRGCRPRQKKGG